jgi:hypothetical protein
MTDSFSREKVPGTAACKSVFTGNQAIGKEDRPNPGNGEWLPANQMY